MDVGGSALITGAASGIGKACARAFIREGAAGVALVDINKEGLEMARADMDEEICLMEKAAEGSGKTARRPRLASYVLDVTDEEQVHQVVQDAAQSLGRLDYVVHAAGVLSLQSSGVASAGTDNWKRTLDVNLNGTFFVLRAATQIMLRQQPTAPSLVGGRPAQRGSIVSIASVLGVRGLSSHTAYAASKHAVVGLIKSAAAAHAKEGLRVNALCPGYTETPMTMARPEDKARVTENATETPMGRMGRPEEIADVALFLAGGRSSFVTGTTLLVDGGYAAK